MTSGIHHVTSITANVQANVDFYAGFLGLRLVKQTGGYEDAEQLHLFYGDGAGNPGTLLSFLVWEAAGRGRTGLGQVSEVGLSVPPEEIGNWLTRAMQAGIPAEGPSQEFGEPVLRLKDPDGMIVKLVGHDDVTADPISGAPIRIRGVTLLTDQAEETAEFITRFGYARGEKSGAVERMVSDTDVVDIRAVGGFVPSISGAGVPDHVAFRAVDVDAVRRMRLSLRGFGDTPVHDRKYFLSLYVREPGGTLIEYATDAPGMSVDEAPDQLGRTLMIPPSDTARAEDLRLMLPQFVMPGEERFPPRDLPFIHRFHRPAQEDGSTLILLHGSGGNEADLMPIAHRIAPQAALLGVRGRSAEEGVNRWFRRFDANRFDQGDIRSEAEAFVAFVEGAIRGYGLDAAKITFVGFSNGANLLGAVMQLYPGVVSRAILLRAVQVLDEPPQADLSGASVLVIEGEKDPWALRAPELLRALREAGADLRAETLVGEGHELGQQDLQLARDWYQGAVA
ncbi:VOC family protein [Falsigemmobacter intermedius]|uniref:Ring-cleaving dioxygenase n=1 Tax=Falsigemmobacter intermedius TaxID=1553448 RepID=A0A3S3UEN2_9RHOB|nr:VOC family protein [Falsigemmobacter intermedius]RWY40071.1 ring-cleaving dioxygenase [Falsigemmobacter intermedius]